MDRTFIIRYWLLMVLGLTGVLSKGITFIKMTPTIATTKSLPVLDDFFWYFAFGSNLLKERIRVQVSSECNKTLNKKYF